MGHRIIINRKTTMKKFLLTSIATLFVGFAMAQVPLVVANDSNKNQMSIRHSGSRVLKSPETLAKERTVNMAKKYGLNEKQTKELQLLCLERVKKMPVRQMKAMHCKKGKSYCAKGQSYCPYCGACKKMKKQKCGPKRHRSVMASQTKEQRQQMQAQRKVVREEFEAGLQKIMTKKQYAAYQKNQTDAKGQFQEKGRRERRHK